jgi:hypothetical protein
MEWQGQTLIFEFGGIQTNGVEEDMREHEIAAQRKISGKHDLLQARAAGKEVVKEHTKTVDQALRALCPEVDTSADLPVDVVQGWTSMPEIFCVAPTSEDKPSDIDIIISIEEEVHRKEKELAERDRIDMDIWEAENMDLVEKLQTKVDDKNVDENKMTLELRMSQALTLFTSSVADAKADATQVADMAKDTFGVDDWQEYPMMKEQKESALAKAEALEGVVEEFGKDIAELQKDLRGSRSGQACKDIMQRLLTLRGDKQKELTSFKKVLGSIRSALKKVEKSRTQGVQATALGSEDGELNLVAVVVDQLCQDRGSYINHLDDLGQAWVAVPKRCFVACDVAWADALEGLPVYKGLKRWLQNQKLDKDKKADRMVCHLEKPSYSQPVLDCIATSTKIGKDMLLARLQSATHGSALAAIFQPQLVFTEPTWSKSGFLDYCLGQFVFVVEGELLIIGICSDDLLGWSYAKKVHEIGELNPEKLQVHLQKPNNFLLKLTKGCLAFIPPSCIVRQHTIKSSWLLRWPVFDTACAAETRRILSSCLSLASSYPDLVQGTYQAWMSCLQDVLSTST